MGLARCWVLWGFFIAAGAAGHRTLRTYRRTSKSLAVLVPQAQGGDGAPAEPAAQGPWWWLVAVRAEDGAGRPAWAELRDALEADAAQERRGSARRATLFGNSHFVSSLLTGLDDVAGGTRGGWSSVGAPQSRCANETRPPKGSFLPSDLPPVPDGHCVLEVSGLAPDTNYHLSLFDVRDIAEVPRHAMLAYVEATAATRAAELLVDLSSDFLLAMSVLSMAAAVSVQGFQSRELFRPSGYKQMEQPPLLHRAASASGFTQGAVRDTMLEMLRDVLRALTMFLPVVGPIGFVLARDVLIGGRIQAVARAAQSPGACARAWNLARTTSSLLVNVVIMPWNVYVVQMTYLIYGEHAYRAIGLDAAADTSFGDIQSRYRFWERAAGTEIIGWLPGILLSVVLLAAEQQNDRMRQRFGGHKERLLQHLRQTPKGGQLYKNLCDMDSSPFGRSNEPGGEPPTQVLCFVLAVIFALSPHIWMCVRHGVPFADGHLAWITITYVINIAGVSWRFLERALLIAKTYKANLHECAFFQALSWQEHKSLAIMDPFPTRNEDVQNARRVLREGELRIAPLNLEDPTESKVWWHLREIMISDLKETRLISEATIFLSVTLSWFAGIICLVLLLDMHEVTSTTLVTAAVMTVMSFFTYIVLRRARDVNLMVTEHTTLLHNVVAEVNMPLRPQRPLDSHLQQERFLLQLATLIERQQPPETIASFAVSPQLFSAIVGAQLLLFGVTVLTFAHGLVALIVA